VPIIRRLAITAAALLCVAASPLKGDYHRLDRGAPRPATTPTGPVLVYYGASWCGPCRAFIPELIAAYPRLRQQGVEILFVADESCAAALDYARTVRMPWLLLPCDPARTARLRRLGGSALPGLVLLDATGNVSASSWHANGTSGPRATLARILSEWP
jgi:thiol-disulfide isomerase/thioredoxin